MLGEFALGVGVYFLLSRKGWAPRPSVAVLVLTAGVAWLAIPNGAIPRLLADGVAAALVVWSGVYLGRAVKPQRILSALGDASYSIYLTHVFVLPYCYRLFNRLHLSEPTALNITVVLFFGVVASAMVGVLVTILSKDPYCAR